jgi:mono/diheme cytochrome c family protein
MVGLSQAQGVILAIGGAIFVAIAGAVLMVRGRRPGAAAPDVPQGMRPGPSDADLETPLLQKLQGWGVLIVVFFVVWVPGTWLLEPDRNLDQERALMEDSIHRGSLGVELFTEENQSGVGCVQCHGAELGGSVILDTTTDPATPIPTPNLRTVCAGPFGGHPAIHGLDDIYTTIEQGRNLMPSWSIRYEGALNDQQINDLVNYIVSIQDEQAVPFEQNVCTNPDAQARADEEFPDKPPATDNPESQL